MNTLTDNYRHQGKRRQLITLLRQKGIEDEAVLNALFQIPRHWFLDSSFEDHAYQDKAFPIGAGQTISQPYTVAFQSALLHIKKGDKVLEIGTGSGYQTAVLCELGATVYGVERQNSLYKKTKRFLDKIGYHPKYLSFGDGYKGLPRFAPFDKILVTCGAPKIPPALLNQLLIGGRMVIPVGDDPQIMTLLIREGPKKIKKKEFGEFRFVPMLPEKN